MIWKREGLGYTYGEISVNLGVDASTVQRTVTLFGSVHKRPYPKDKAARKLTPIAQLFVLNLVKKPGIYLYEIQKELQVSLLLEVSLSTLCKFLHTNGFTHKKTSYSCFTARQTSKGEVHLRSVRILNRYVYIYW